MKLIIDTEKRTIEAEGNTTEAIYDIIGGCDIEFSRKIEAVRLGNESMANFIPVGRVGLSISNLHAVERKEAGEVVPVPEPPEDRDVRTPGFLDLLKK